VFDWLAIEKFFLWLNNRDGCVLRAAIIIPPAITSNRLWLIYIVNTKAWKYMPVYFFRRYHSGGKSLQWLFNELFLFSDHYTNDYRRKMQNAERETHNAKYQNVQYFGLKR